tara:strand:+ start:3406 stop:3774 length:369 start_codon:yes stop_codon:yes gene_type:complete
MGNRAQSWAQTEVVSQGGSLLVVKRAVVNTASANTTLVAAVTSAHIRVVFMTLVLGAAANIRLESTSGGTALTGVMEIAANGGIVWPFNPVGWVETTVGELLNLEQSGTVNIDGVVGYIEAL